MIPLALFLLFSALGHALGHVLGSIPVSTIHEGCDALDFSTDPCFMEDAEILPAIHIPQNGILHHITTPEECQQHCDAEPDCLYFTHRVHRETEASTCHLRPAPSNASSPIMTFRRYTDASAFRYVSGPKMCGQECTDGEELADGCGGASPAVCEMFGESSFDALCGTNPTGNCGTFGYRCCRDCSRLGDCCLDRVAGRLLVGGTDLPSAWQGIVSPGECHTMCLKTSSCTHWNFISSSSVEFIGSACYLKSYDPPNTPVAVNAPQWSTSIIGAVDCSQDFGLDSLNVLTTESPSTTETAEVSTFMSTTAMRTTAMSTTTGECFTTGIDYVEGTLYRQWGVFDVEDCQRLCQTWPGCVVFVFDSVESACALKFSTFGRTVAAEAQAHFVSGPRDCPGVEPAPEVESCFEGDMDIDADNVHESQTQHAAECGRQCMWFQYCQGWAFFNGGCYLKGADTPRVASPGVAAGSRDCVWPNYSRRALDGTGAAEDILPSFLITQGCAREDKDYYGGLITIVPNINSIEECREICLSRADCKAMSFVLTDKLCKIHWGGEVVDKVGVIAAGRDCPCEGDHCMTLPLMASASGVSVPVPGIALHSLGRPSAWIVNGQIPDFTHPSAWQRIAILLMTDDPRTDCYVSDLLGTETNCWLDRTKYLPLEFRIQVIAVAVGTSFKGWNNIDWDIRDTTLFDGHLEFLNEVINLVEADHPGTDHGVWLKPIDDAISSRWPSDLTTPLNFKDGEFYLRVQSLESPIPISYRLRLCITGDDSPTSETCTAPLVVPPFDK